MPFFSKALAIIIGSFILAIGIDVFLSPIEVLDGGFIGIGLIFKYLWGIKAGLTIIMFSIPVLILAWFKYRNYFYNSVHGMLISSFMIDLLQPLEYYFASYVQTSPLLSSIMGGAFIGLGIGIMLRYETSTGGADLLAQFLTSIFHINVGVMIFIIDAIIISLGGLLFSSETFFLSGVTITAGGVVTSLCTLKHTC
ncbi:hypothetical protein AM501_29445 [Aneurinibacillus migulanus]|uniref:YitT family protein n=1 Tax=Aneurinibacillus migulanus TaxID=47500 RepID=UPI0005BA986C|nr:YitT family protein [Aneurinibacillus migulanus]KIV56868.1 hypothetical protein TS64_08885 [Aneurinibacillus migulanus]KPD04847.1 hypothetical protein AM501_29445 [Aneurinibacillus migulanus]MCP1359145.1 YitT family protein [Aneurinibacillus migulanus]MED4730641.1 YitT family protein [Aneurinibacillus migulanus]CEH29038.1 Uncharacterized protein BN1090_A2_01462 [Aneurinibacillus migulanus]